MATHSSVLAWRIPGTGEPAELPSMGSHRVGHNWSDLTVSSSSRVNLTNMHQMSSESLWHHGTHSTKKKKKNWLMIFSFLSVEISAIIQYGSGSIATAVWFIQIKNNPLCSCITLIYLQFVSLTLWDSFTKEEGWTGCQWRSLLIQISELLVIKVIYFKVKRKNVMHTLCSKMLYWVWEEIDVKKQNQSS